jgi:competence protein ComEC
VVSRRIEEKQTAGQALTAGWHRWLDAERAHLPLWLPVALAAGIALWFALPWAPWRQAAACAAAALAIGFLLAGLRPLAWMALLLLAGLGVSELRVALNHHPVLAGRVFATVTARVESAEPLAFGDQRLVLVPAAGHSLPGGTQRLRLRLRGEQPQIAAGAIITARALLSPPSGMAIPPATAQAMRDAGLAHLLSISGLHIAVVVGIVALLMRWLLGLWPWLVRVPVPTLALALAAGALAGLAYTLLAGAQVPTVRAVIAACIVVVGMMLGRQALSLRLLAAAAFAILVVRPEALLGASFQMSFAAVIGIVALYESRLGKWLTAVREDEPWWQWLARAAASLLASGLVAELALSGIGLYHFGRSGLYGIAANLIAVPYTSCVVMPALMLAMLGEALGLGWLWPLAGWAMQQLIALADFTASLPGAVITSAAIPGPAFALGAAGGLWLALWRSRARWWGLAPLAGAVLLAWSAAVPDLLISSDGRHLALRLPDGRLAHSSERVGDFLIDNWAEAVGSDPASAVWLGTLPLARCSAESCVATMERGGRRWRVLATTGRSLIPRDRFAPACAAADIVVSDRRLPDWCRSRWLKLDAAAVAQTGAVAIWLDVQHVATAVDATGDRPWQPH